LKQVLINSEGFEKGIKALDKTTEEVGVFAIWFSKQESLNNRPLSSCWWKLRNFVAFLGE
jgi:hypothetical protein